MTSAAGLAPTVRPQSLRPQLYRVLSRVEETASTTTLALAPEGAGVATAAPGQFNMLWAWGAGEAPISVSATGPSGTLLHTIREAGGVTTALLRAQPGDVVGVRGPFGRGWDLDAARGRDVVIVAGGIGLAPLRLVVHAILAERDAYGQVALIVGSRSPDELVFRAELDRWWLDRQIVVRTIVDRPALDWYGNVGVVTHELPRIDIDPEQTVAMICGPEIMMRLVGAHLAERGVAGERIQVSLERNMQCGIVKCGHCQLAGQFVCGDGPVFTLDTARALMEVREL